MEIIISFFYFFRALLVSSFWTKPWSQMLSLPPPRFFPSISIAQGVQQSHCSSIFHRVMLTHALAFSASQLVRKKRSPRIYTSMHSGGIELTKLTYTRLDYNLIRHRGDRCDICVYHLWFVCFSPGVFLSSRATGACPVTTDLIMRVNVRTTTTTTTYYLRACTRVRARRVLQNRSVSGRKLETRSFLAQILFLYSW